MTSKRRDTSFGVRRVHKMTLSFKGSPLATPCKKSAFTLSDCIPSSEFPPQAVSEIGKDKAPKLANDFCRSSRRDIFKDIIFFLIFYSFNIKKDCFFMISNR